MKRFQWVLLFFVGTVGACSDAVRVPPTVDAGDAGAAVVDVVSDVARVDVGRVEADVLPLDVAVDVPTLPGCSRGTACDLDGDGEDGPQCGGQDCDDRDCRRRHGDGREVADLDGHDEDCNPCTIAGRMDGDRDGDGALDRRLSNPWIGATAPVCGDSVEVVREAMIVRGRDCNDDPAMRGASQHPALPEVCGNAVDDDCDGRVDYAERLYEDRDNDGRGNPSVMSSGMCRPGFVTNDEDCDDTRPETYRGAREQCDGRDNDCSSPGAAQGGAEMSEDMDGDRHSAPSAMCLGRGEPGALANAFPRDDCDDMRRESHPGAPELCDRRDNDCMSGGGVAPDEDRDEDGHAPTGATCIARGEVGATSAALPRDDCDDTRAAVHGGRDAMSDLATCDGLDNDCNPATSELARADACAGRGYCLAGGVCGPGSTPQQVVTGGGFTCVRLGDGSARCWGSNRSGQLGDGTTTSAASPVTVAGLSQAVELAAGDTHICARMGDGTVRCWGSNQSGQLGDGSTERRTSPSAVPGLTEVAEVDASIGSTCVRLRSGALRCWGRNEHGQLGDGTTMNRTRPVVVDGLSGAAQLAMGNDHSCARLIDGGVRCWGRNQSGQLGNGSLTAALRPVVVAGLGGVAELAAGGDFTCGLTGVGGVSCWGDGASGQLGNGARINQTSPVAVSGITEALGVAAGGYHACVWSRAGAASCWGSRAFAQLGDGQFGGSRSTPTPVMTLSEVQQLSLGTIHSCALLRGGGIRCWGGNTLGQLGDGTQTERAAPVVVTIP